MLKCSEASKGEHSTETKNIHTEIGCHPRSSHLVQSCRASNTGNTSWKSCSVRTSSTICSACGIRFSLPTFNLNFNFFEERSSRERMEIFILVHPIFSIMEDPFASHHCWVCLCNRFSYDVKVELGMDNPKLHVGRIHWTTWRKTSSQLLLELPTLQTFWPGLWTFDSSSPARLLFGLYSLNLWDKGGGHYSCCKCSLVQKQQVVTKILIEPRFKSFRETFSDSYKVCAQWQ